MKTLLFKTFFFTTSIKNTIRASAGFVFGISTYEDNTQLHKPRQCLERTLDIVWAAVCTSHTHRVMVLDLYKVSAQH